jgi:hypothetical protein
MKTEEIKAKLDQHGISRFINEYLLSNFYEKYSFTNDRELLWHLKSLLSKSFNIQIRNLEIVGSAKLGVGYNEGMYNKKFSEESDIDIVIVSNDLFEKAWFELLQIEDNYYDLGESGRGFLEEAYKTIHAGFISPDRIPKSMEFHKKWWAVFEGLSNKSEYDNRKIRGRLFKNWWFVEKYYSKSFSKIYKKHN